MQDFGTNTDANTVAVDLGSIPEGKRLVIENVSFLATVPVGDHVKLTLVLPKQTQPFGSEVVYLRAFDQGSSTTIQYYIAQESLRLYADHRSIGSSSISASVYNLNYNSGDEISLQANVSGYLIDLP